MRLGSSRLLRFHILTTVFRAPDSQFEKAVTGKAGLRAMRMPSFDPEVAPVVNSQQNLNCSITRFLNYPIFLSVNLSQHNVDASDRGDYVRQQMSLAHGLQRLKIRKARRPHVHAIWLGGSVTHDVIAHLSTRGFDCLIDLTRRYCKAFRNDLKVIDEGLHLSLHLLAVRQDDTWRIGLDRTFRHAVESLPNDPNRVAQLLYPAHIPGEHIAFLRDRNLKLELLVARIWHVAPQVDVHAAAPQCRSSRSQRDGVL